MNTTRFGEKTEYTYKCFTKRPALKNPLWYLADAPDWSDDCVCSAVFKANVSILLSMFVTSVNCISC